MGLFKKNNVVNNQQEVQKDDWMREDYILVSNKTKAKHLKPYQRLVVLRTPNGEKRCIVDKSLPYSEINKIQHLMKTQGFVDINSNEFNRIIPNDFKNTSDCFELTNDVVNKEIGVLKSMNDIDFKDQEFDPYQFDKSLLKLEDENYTIKLNKKDKTLKSNTVNDTDIIDDINIYIPHEERRIRWDLVEGFDEVDRKVNNILNNQNQQDDSYQEDVELFQDDYDIVDNKPVDEINQEEQVQLFDQNEQQVDGDQSSENINQEVVEQETVEATQPEYPTTESDYTDYQDGSNETNEPIQDIQTVTSFFKNEVSYDKNMYNTSRHSGNFYRFYQDTNTQPFEAKIVNKKAKMVIKRRKIDKQLIEANAARRSSI